MASGIFPYPEGGLFHRSTTFIGPPFRIGTRYAPQGYLRSRLDDAAEANVTEAGNQREKTEGTKGRGFGGRVGGTKSSGTGSGYYCVLAEPLEGMAHAFPTPEQIAKTVTDKPPSPTSSWRSRWSGRLR